MTLEERMTRMEDTEAIRYLQAKYQRCLDCRDFDGIASCFTDDVKSAYGNGEMSYDGKDAVIGFLCKSMALNMPSTHFIHGGEIDILNDHEAKAKWYLEDNLLLEQYKMNIHGAAVYDNEYVKIDGKWLIKKIGYKRCYEYRDMLSDMVMQSLGKKTFLDAVKEMKMEDAGKYNQLFIKENVEKK